MTDNNYYQAGAYSLHELFFDNTRERWGVRIPNYQRIYKWKSSDQIARFRYGIYSDFCKLAIAAEKTTFLGSIIFAQQDKMASMQHSPVDIVDGQQRITTLTIFITALITKLSKQLKNLGSITSLKEEQKEWLKNELRASIAELERFVFIEMKEGRKISFLPRLFRWQDNLGHDFASCEFNSVVGKLVLGLSITDPDKYQDYEFPKGPNPSDEEKLIQEVYTDFSDFMDILSNENELYEIEYEFLTLDKLKRKQFKALLKADVEKHIETVVKLASKDVNLAHILRLLFFSNYLMQKCGFATVIAKTPSAAFDIFDALNTTGVPLTAVETLKPEVIQYYEETSGINYSGSQAEDAFNWIDTVFDESFPETSQQDRETKILASVAGLYLKGEKIDGSLSSQRTALRNLQNEAIKNKKQDDVIISVKKVLEYRQSFFRKDGIAKIATMPGLSNDQVSQVKLISNIFFEGKKLLVGAPLTRYYQSGKLSGDLSEYFAFLKALAAFTVLRRAATGTTDSIDRVYRQLMRANGGLNIATCFDEKKILPDISIVHSFLASHLSSKKLKFNLSDKEDWVNHVANQPLYTNSTFLRFLLLAAHNGSAVDPVEKGLITRVNVTPSTSRDFLNYETWRDDVYETLEHIAPQHKGSVGYDGVYSNSTTVHTIGNFTLVPGKQNNNLGTSSWKAKKEFFSALGKNNANARENSLNNAIKSGMKISTNRMEDLKKAKASELLKGLNSVPKWDKDFIEKRSKRLCELAWDELVKWLQ